MISINGFGKLLLNIFKINEPLFKDCKNLEFIIGLIFIGLFSIIINLFSNLNDLISICIIFLGLVSYFFFFLKIDNKIKEIYTILFVVLISIFFSFYATINDDFDYHFKTINNFKEFAVFDIIHGRRISYNSHWLLINSAYYLSYFPATVFCITSLFYSLTIFDFYNSFKKNLLNEYYLTSIYSFFVLIFLLGVLNQFKEYGTDFPGQLILFYISLFFLKFINSKKNYGEIQFYLIILLLAFFAVAIKISNSLIFILLIFIYLQLQQKKLLLFLSIIVSIPTFFWIVQNYIISECLIWPVSFTCLENVEKATIEMNIIESFAKGDINAFVDTTNFQWVYVWFNNHFKKLIEIYGFYFILSLSPVLIFYFKSTLNNKNHSKIKIKELLFKFEYPYSFFVFIIIIFNIIWFIKAPAYRFGVFYNLSFLIIILIPFWEDLLSKNKKFATHALKFLLLVSIIFFIYKNIAKYDKYIDRYGVLWPNIVNGKLIQPLN